MESSKKISFCIAAFLLLSAVQALPFDSISDSNRPYKGYQVFEVTPSNDEQITVLSKLNEQQGVDFWSFRPGMLQKNVFSVSPDLIEEITESLSVSGVKFAVLIDDLQDSIDRETLSQKSTNINIKDSEKSATFKRYMRYHEIEEYAKELETSYPERVTVESMGKTVEGRELWVIRITNESAPRAGKKPAIFIDAGIHAREWIAPATAIYVLNQIVENQIVSSDLLDGLDWYIAPVLNPDGYEHTHTTKNNYDFLMASSGGKVKLFVWDDCTNANLQEGGAEGSAVDRLWRKNRRSFGECIGVDLNRNFEFHWNEIGASSNPCSDVYSGPKALSEPESKIVSDFILKVKSKITTYLTLHSYGYYILYPWGYTSNLPEDWKELDNIAKEANAAMVAAGSDPYTVGSSTNALYPAAGGSDDWAKGVAGIEKSYTIELPGGGPSGFDLPPAYIQGTVTEVFEGIKVFAKHAKKL